MDKYYLNVTPNDDLSKELKELLEKRIQHIKTQQQENEIAVLKDFKSQILEARRIESEREKKNNIKKEQVQKKRAFLERKYGARLPSYNDLFEILNLVPTIDERNSQIERNRFINLIESKGYMLYGLGGNKKIYSDINTFKNSKDYEISTLRSTGSNGQLSYSVRFVIPDVNKELVDLYVDELNSGFRLSKSSSRWVLNYPKNLADYESPLFSLSGGTIYHLEIEDKSLKAMALDNSYKTSSYIYNERVIPNVLKITPWSNTTDIEVKKGQRISFYAEGQVALGIFAGKSSPNGIKGYTSYSITSQHNHGSLIGRIDEGPWFSIGSISTINAPDSGKLEIRVNDKDPSNNSGFFYLAYDID